MGCTCTHQTVLQKKTTTTTTTTKTSTTTTTTTTTTTESGDRITGLTWSYIVGVGCMPWFERVDSASNHTTGLSRERLQGFLTLGPIPACECLLGRVRGGLVQTTKCLPRAAVIRRLTHARVSSQERQVAVGTLTLVGALKVSIAGGFGFVFGTSLCGACAHGLCRRCFRVPLW